MECRGCKKEFTSNIAKQVFCCRHCKNLYYVRQNRLKKAKEHKYCKVCFKTISGSGTKYCSKKCQNTYFRSIEKSKTYKTKLDKWVKKLRLVFNIN